MNDGVPKCTVSPLVIKQEYTKNDVGGLGGWYHCIEISLPPKIFEKSVGIGKIYGQLRIFKIDEPSCYLSHSQSCL
jgi:hypothetical protein